MDLRLVGLVWALLPFTAVQSGTARVPDPVRTTIRPGDTWFDHVDAVRVDRWPASNLPASLREDVAVPYRAHTRPINRFDWVRFPALPEALRPRLPANSLLGYFEAKTRLFPAAERPRPRVLLGTLEAKELPRTGSLGAGPWFWWDAAAGRLCALADTTPNNAVVEYWADPAVELGSWELALADPARAVPGWKPQAELLRRRITTGSITTDALYLPAGAAITLPVAELRADRLRIALALHDYALRERKDRGIEAARRLTDGVTVSVEGVIGGARRRLWTRTIAADQAGGDFVEGEIDLSSARGKAVELRLVTEPGPGGDPSFDYVSWTRLRFEGQSTQPPTRPHVILIDLDTLRADGLSLYGAAHPTSPFLERWSRRGATTYRDCMLTAPWTLPSTISILTGLYVHQHGVDSAASPRLGANPMLASTLRAVGYETWAECDGGFVHSAFGFADGFDWFRSEFSQAMPWNRVLEDVKRRRSDRPLFLFLHTYSTHAPYTCDTRFEPAIGAYSGPLKGLEIDNDNVIDRFQSGALALDEADRAYVRRLYDASVARTDENLARFLVGLDAALQGSDYMVIITSDHGEAFFEHGRMGHGDILYRELTHVPLLIRYPKSVTAPPPGDCDDPVSAVDIVPTILECVGLEKPAFLAGRSLLSAGSEPGPRLAYQAQSRRCITHAGWKLIVSGMAPSTTFELFDLENDPWEQKNLAAAQPARVADLKTLLDRFEQRYPRLEQEGGAAGTLDPQALEGLRELGYVR